MCQPGFWLVQRVVGEPVVAVVEQSVTASRYVDCVVPCKGVEVEERLGPCWAPEPCGRIGRERKLCRVKAVRTSGRERRLCRVIAVRTSGQERRLCRVQSRADERTRTKALSGQSRADERTRAKALSGQSRANERTGHEAEAKMGVILALRR